MQDAERIAKLEVAKENNDSDMAEMKVIINHMRDTLDSINLRMASMKGFVAGVSFVFGLIGTGAALAVNYVMNRGHG